MDDQIRVTVIATGFEDRPSDSGTISVEMKLSEEEQTQTKQENLFTAASEMAAEAAAPVAEPPKPATEEDPFDSIFRIFNSK